MFEIYYLDDVNIDKSSVEAILSFLTEELDIDGSFSLTFVDEKKIKELNKEYRNKDEVTDILTFALCDDSDFPDFDFLEEEKEYGDIFINQDRARENANEFNITFDQEILRLCIHGVLHLLGYDHKTNDFQTEEMLIMQEELLTKYLSKV